MRATISLIVFRSHEFYAIDRQQAEVTRIFLLIPRTSDFNSKLYIVMDLIQAEIV